MGLITKPNPTANGTTADGSAVSANFDTIYAEFNGSIDNNNIKPSAGLADTKLATITTAGKVNASALTGTITSVISTTNITATTVTATSLSGITTLSATTITATTTNSITVSATNYYGIQGLFGVWSAAATATVVQAATDGFIKILRSTSGTGTVLSDGSNPPTTIAGSFYTDGSGTFVGVYPIRKGDYWKVPAANTVSWMPMGS